MSLAEAGAFTSMQKLGTELRGSQHHTPSRKISVSLCLIGRSPSHLVPPRPGRQGPDSSPSGAEPIIRGHRTPRWHSDGGKQSISGRVAVIFRQQVAK